MCVEPTAWHKLQTDRGVRLCCADFGGTGPAVVLLHGLAGSAGEWSETAGWLSRSHRVVAPEQRGHGRSERHPGDMSRSAFVDDAAEWITALGLAPAIVVGQSLGGHTAFLLAARRPGLVLAAVVAEATPQADPGAPAAVREWLGSWPVPFASRRSAEEFFGRGRLWARTWAAGLEERLGGLWPAFDPAELEAALAETGSRSYWDEWASLRCPVLVIRAAGSEEGAATYRRMVDSVPDATLVEVAGAGHDLHLDRPERWRIALSAFLARLL